MIRRKHGLFGVACVVVCAAACSSIADRVVDAGADAGPPLDPKLFDCTSLPNLPARKAASTPECLRDPKCTTRLVSAHRGAGGQLGRIAPEDTLAAYRAGIAMGVDLVETDPRPTSDGVLVNIHDPTLDRTTTGTGDVAAHTFAEIEALSIRADGFAGDFSCEKVPTLTQLLQTCVGRAMVLVDANKTDRVDLLVQAIHDANAVDWAVFDTSDTAKIDAALAIDPNLMIQPRIENAADAPTILAKYASHLPVFVEVSSTIWPQTADLVHAAGTRALTDVFGIDLGVKFGSDPAAYLDAYAQGADVAQSDLPDIVLRTLGRPVPP
jgi:glycerophosphoryl diester phosphodiesterase